MPAVVSDASPLIYLCHLGHFRFLRDIYGTVLVPPTVWIEVGERGAHRPEGQALKAGVETGWIQVTAPASETLADPALLHLGSGEREAIQLAYERRALLLIDEADGRIIALRLGIQITGTLGVLLEAKEKKLLTGVRPAIERLVNETNFRVSDQVRQHILRLAREL